MNLADKKGTIIQFIKFGIVGLSNTLISFAVYYPLIYIGVNYLLANILAFIISVVNAYFWQNRYVFDKGEQSHIKALTRVFASYSLSFLLAFLLLFIQVDLLGVSEYIAPIINLVITVPLNFVVNKFWAYKEKR